MELAHIQSIISQFTGEKKIDSKVEIRIVDLASEVGELSKEVLKGTDYGKREFKITEDWLSELGDVFFSLLCIANESNTDLEASLNTVLKKYEERFERKGNLSSGGDH